MATYIPHLNQYKCRMGHFYDSEKDADMCCNGYTKIPTLYGGYRWILTSEYVKYDSYLIKKQERQRKIDAAAHARKAKAAKRSVNTKE